MNEDEDFNYVFATLVQSFPCLYDTSMAEFHDDVARERAWQEIALDVGDGTTSEDCRNRWTKMRQYFVQSLETDGTKQEPDDLLDALRFLTPYVNSCDSMIEEDRFDEFRYRLVFLVKRHPCLYDRSVARTGNLSAARSKAWSTISANLGGERSPEDCRLVWEAIRARYTEYVEANFQNRKPYVLANSLSFLARFVKSRRIKQNRTPSRFPRNYKFNCRFIRVVQGFPCLYDTSTAQYGKGNLDTWSQVAQRVGGNVTAANCKLRWKCIRNAFACRLGNKYGSYYLADHLEFLKPFMKPYELVQGPAVEDAVSDIEQETGASNNFSRRLIPLVRDFPQIYNPAHPSYPATEAWIEIAKRLGGKVTAKRCQQRWHYIRKLFVLKYGSQSEYYLTDQLQFLKPFIGKTAQEEPCQVPEILEQPPVVECHRGHGTDYTLVDTEDDDALFLLSLAPNLRRLDAKQKRAFKARMLLLAQEMHE